MDPTKVVEIVKIRPLFFKCYFENYVKLLSIIFNKSLNKFASSLCKWKVLIVPLRKKA